MELATSGQLYSLIKEKRKFSELKVAYILRQICEAVRYLHAFKIIHRDIKPENIVIEHVINLFI
jgi:serine/threonine protein kinase